MDHPLSVSEAQHIAQDRCQRIFDKCGSLAHGTHKHDTLCQQGYHMAASADAAPLRMLWSEHLPGPTKTACSLSLIAQILQVPVLLPLVPLWGRPTLEQATLEQATLEQALPLGTPLSGCRYSPPLPCLWTGARSWFPISV
jgi:hypothetical protein